MHLSIGFFAALPKVRILFKLQATYNEDIVGGILHTMDSISLRTTAIAFGVILLIFIGANTIFFQQLFGLEALPTLAEGRDDAQSVANNAPVNSTITIDEGGRIALADGNRITDDFEVREDNLWAREWGDFNRVSFGGSQTWSSVGSAETFRTGSETWGDFTLRLRFHPLDFGDEGTLNFKIRRPANAACDHYNLTITQSALSLARQNADCSVENNIFFEEIPIAAGTWHTLYLQAEGATLRWQVNDSPVYQFDDMLFTRGGLGILSYRMGTVFFDDVVVSLPQ